MSSKSQAAANQGRSDAASGKGAANTHGMSHQSANTYNASYNSQKSGQNSGK